MLGNANPPTRPADGIKPRVRPRIEFQDHGRMKRQFTAVQACAEAANTTYGLLPEERPGLPRTSATDEAFNTLIAALVVGLLCVIAVPFFPRRRRRALGEA